MSRSGDARVDETADPAGAGIPAEPVVKIAPSPRLRSHGGGGHPTDPEQKPVPRRVASPACQQRLPGRIPARPVKMW